MKYGSYSCRCNINIGFEDIEDLASMWTYLWWSFGNWRSCVWDTRIWICLNKGKFWTQIGTNWNIKHIKKKWWLMVMSIFFIIIWTSLHFDIQWCLLQENSRVHNSTIRWIKLLWQIAIYKNIKWKYGTFDFPSGSCIWYIFP